MRGVWKLVMPSMLMQRWVKVVPHVNDTLLLVSALLLAASMGQYPFVNSWLTAKVLALIVYIGLGTAAFRLSKSPQGFLFWWILAVVVFAYIVSVAFTKNPYSFFTIIQ